MYNQRQFTPGRASFNNFATPDGCTFHTYYTLDPVDTVLAPNYFPPYFGFDSSFVNPLDTLLINTSANQTFVCQIASVNPISLNATQTAQRFPTAQASGAYTGTLDVMFSKDLNTKLITFLLCKKAQLTTANSNSSIQLFLGSGLPTNFKPASDITPINFGFLGYNVSGNAAFLGCVYIDISQVVIGPYTVSTGAGLFGPNTNIVLTNFSVIYRGE